MAAELVVTKLAEAVVSQAVQRIADLLIKEAASLSSVRDDLQNLQTELSYMQSFLKNADTKQEQDELVRKWVAEVRDVACEIEDAIETYIFKVHSSYVKAFHLRKLRNRIYDIKAKLRSISERAQRYQININTGEGSNSAINLSRKSYPLDEEDDIISLKESTVALKAQLMEEEDRLCVVSIVGMGGLGKTTLAKKVYNDNDVKKQFDCRAWVFISQQFVPREVLSEILMQVGFQQDQLEEKKFGKEKYTKEFLEERKSRREILKGLEDHELIDLMKNVLADKKYLIILDDIWSIDSWYRLRSAFPKGKMGSKILFTTRIKEVATTADSSSSPIEPLLLTLAESWELLQRKVFPRQSNGLCGCPPEFEELGKEIVGKCGGLPLAIVVIGGLLRTKNSLEGWENVRKYVKSHIINKIKSEQPYRVEDILYLSFQDLPFYLKPCFLYLGRFPEDSEIPRNKLIRLWMAEGFIPPLRKEDLEETSIEDVAEKYLGELIDRCMVQVGERDHTGKGIKTCRLHDLMRDFCISKSYEEGFFEIMDKNRTKMMIHGTSPIQNFTTARSRRVAIHVNHGLDRCAAWMEQVHPHLRSLWCFGIDTFPVWSLRNKTFRLLRVLEIDFNVASKLPNAKLLSGIGNLIQLRYLRLSAYWNQLKVPYSIGNLQNLDTLDLGNNYWLVSVPWTISRLTNLRHLSLPEYELSDFSATIRSLLSGNYTLANIETLKGIHARDLIRNGAVPTFSNILNLKIREFRSGKQVSLVLESLRSPLSRLRSLGMEMEYNCEFPNLELLSHHQDLIKLELFGELSQENFSLLPKSLTKLILVGTTLNQEKLAGLEKLPNLRILRMNGGCNSDGYKWVCSVNGFPKLEILTLARFESLEEWEVEEGAMPNLKRLNISFLQRTGNGNLPMIPDGLKYVSTLVELNIRGMKKEFEDRLIVKGGIEGEDFYKVRHVPNISISQTW